MKTCEVCNQPVQHFYDQDNGDILVVAWSAFKHQAQWDKNAEIETIIRSEMTRNRIPMIRSRLTFYSVWGHKPSERRSKLGKELYAKCGEAFRKKFFEVAKGRHVLLYGSEAVKFLTTYTVSEVSSLAIPEDGFFWTAKSVYASEKLGKTFGELKLSIRRFAEFIQKSDTLEVQ